MIRFQFGISGAKQRRKVFLGSVSTLALAAAALPVQAQTQKDTADAQPAQLQTITVFGHERDYKADLPSISKLTEPLVDTPQSITTITSQLIDDRGATTLNDALRNVPGISLGAGEFSWQGTNLTLRGFNARNDIYMDGMRDFGSYYRDPFNLDQVQVLEGPSSILFGRGSTGGVINQTSKQATLTPLTSGTLSFGTDETKRITADIDQPLPEFGEGVAARLNVMGHDSMQAGRAIGENQRFGVAPTLAFGLGTPTRVTLSYFHQTEDDTPDYGIPWFAGSPAPVPRNNFYGFKGDHLHTDADIVTARVEHDFNDAIRVSSQLRYADYRRDFRISEPTVPTSFSPALNPPSTITISRNEWIGNSQETMLQDQTDATFKFETGGLEHTVVTGFEVGSESSDPVFKNSLDTPTDTLLNPNENQIYTGQPYLRLRSNTDATSFAAYVLDTIKIGEQWQLIGGWRWDRFDSTFKGTYYTVPPAQVNQFLKYNAANEVDQIPSYRGAVVYKPTPDSSVYFAYGTSFNPSAEMLTQITSGRGLGTGYEGLAPEKNQNFEFGTKWDLFNHRLALSAALFREEKTNARVPDPHNSGFFILAGEQRVDGVDLEAVGRITDAWQVHAGYTYLHSVQDGTTLAAGSPPVGAALANVPKHSATLWTEYRLPFGLELGGGINYMSSRVAQVTAPVETVPGYITFDAMAKYPLTEQIVLQVNVYNLTDRYFYDQIHNWHIVPGAGRSALFSASFKY
ncbi:MAG TPA: TonB-dependent siderophore receptor [Alphaproteobacteria bacterium]|nr:TonB-dependent siderophore receptor [Alphaproteobacteria bacterium]